MTPQTIKSKLVKRGIRQADIARKIAVSRQCVNKTIVGKMRSDKIETAISKALNLPIERVFPKGRKK